jgi:hypothetical protein
LVGNEIAVELNQGHTLPDTSDNIKNILSLTQGYAKQQSPQSEDSKGPLGGAGAKEREQEEISARSTSLLGMIPYTIAARGPNFLNYLNMFLNNYYRPTKEPTDQYMTVCFLYWLNSHFTENKSFNLIVENLKYVVCSHIIGRMRREFSGTGVAPWRGFTNGSTKT